MKSKEIKKLVAETSAGYKLALFMPVFIFSVLSTVSSLFGILALVFLIVTPPLNYGITSVFIRRRNGEEIAPFDFVGEGFSNFGRAWKISLRLFVKYLVPVLIIMFATVGTIIFSVSSVFATEGLALMPSTSSISSVGAGVMGIVVWIAYLVSFILLIPLFYKYRYAYNEAIMSPESSSKEVVRNTAEVMNGNKWKSFCLDCSYLLLGIASAIVAGFIGGFLPDILSEIVIAAIVAYFYTAAFTMAHVIFYEDKRTQKFGSVSAPSSVIENGPAVADNDFTTPIN